MTELRHFFCLCNLLCFVSSITEISSKQNSVNMLIFCFLSFVPVAIFWLMVFWLVAYLYQLLMQQRNKIAALKIFMGFRSLRFAATISSSVKCSCLPWKILRNLGSGTLWISLRERARWKNWLLDLRRQKLHSCLERSSMTPELRILC